MQYPSFFDAVPAIVVADPLARFLGTASSGLIEYRYIDAVKLAGHSCPTVAGAWLTTRAALARLYPGATPQRGEIRVELRQAVDEGVAGVVASVAALVTGAAGDGGFKGIGGRFARRGLLRHGVAMAGDIRFTRLENGHSVELVYHGQRVARPPAIGTLLPAALAAEAGTGVGDGGDARREFAETWKRWVRAILVDHADDPALVEVVAERYEPPRHG